MSSWVAVLEEMEARVADVDRVLLQGGVPVSKLEIPDGLGPLPQNLRGRAERVYALTVDAEFRVEAARDGVLSALRSSPERPAAPSYVDRRA